MVAGKPNRDRKIPEIDNPAVEEKLNKLTVGPISKEDKMSSMKNAFARSRGKFRTNERSKANIRELTKDDSTKLKKVMRSRNRTAGTTKQRSFRQRNSHKENTTATGISSKNSSHAKSSHILKNPRRRTNLSTNSISPTTTRTMNIQLRTFINFVMD